ncbi:MAG: ABC transporter ATP-binding protein, partial [Candidatus Methanomethylophilaceae archaeon]|nr:ABC transporter ATP-binding protein [Candidatus Methanomethylophilaceae archaeon]
MSSSFGTTLRYKMFHKVSGFSSGDFSGVSVASMVTRSTNDINQIQQFVGRAMQIVVKSPIMAIWAIMKISEGAWEWTAITIIGVLFLVTVILFVMWYTMKYFRRMQVLKDNVNKHARESIVGVRLIRAYNADEFHNRKLVKASEELKENNLTVFRVMVPMFSVTGSISNFMTIAIYWTGALIINGTMDAEEEMLLFSDMIVFSSYAIQVLSAFSMMTEIIRNYPSASVSSSRIQEILNKEKSIIEGQNKESDKGRATVEFSNVCFRYPGYNSEVLKNVSFKVEEGSTTVIVGSTGCGKTTMARLIQRFYDPTEGSILVDGRNVSDYDFRTLYSRLSYVPQNPIIFGGTIRENVCYGDDNNVCSDDEIWDALDIAQIGEHIRGLEKGLDTHVVQNGNNLSGGQKQRISIARAICHKPEIIIFDDSFSALDFKTERLLREAIMDKLSGMTKIIITQRVGIAMDADQILVMDKGQIVDRGVHEDLYARSETYRDLVKSQLSEVKR